MVVGLGTVNDIGIVIDCFDCKVPSRIFGTKSLSFVKRNLKKAELLPGLYNLISLYVENYSEDSSKWNFNSVVDS